jgi:hypothetical protein
MGTINKNNLIKNKMAKVVTTTFVSNDEQHDELELFISKDNTLRIYITPKGDINDWMRHACMDIDLGDVELIIEELLKLKSEILLTETE